MMTDVLMSEVRLTQRQGAYQAAARGRTTREHACPLAALRDLETLLIGGAS